MFFNAINRYSGSNSALDIVNENRYRSYMSDHEKPPQRRPNMPAELPRNDKTPMRLTSLTLLRRFFCGLLSILTLAGVQAATAAGPAS